MHPSDSQAIAALLAQLMDQLRARQTLTAEVQRAEREFFQANPRALETDRSAGIRFGEWFLIERESDVLGGVPAQVMPMSAEQRESLTDSLMGVFVVTGANPGEYVVIDLQDEKTHDVTAVEGVELQAGDLMIGRLFDGPLDVYVTSPALACQRQAPELAAAFARDAKSLGLDRRLNQAEIEHLMFRNRGSIDNPAAEAVEETVPLERLEADLERCLHDGGIDSDELSVTAVSASLRGIPRPGMVVDPLMEKIAFDTEVDIERARSLMLEIWQHHDTHAGPLEAAAAEPPRVPEPEPVDTPSKPPVEPEHEAGTTAPAGLGASVRARIEVGMTNNEDLEQVFTEADAMVGEDDLPEPQDELSLSGNLRPLITEYLWETKAAKQGDDAVLEQFVTTQCQASVPQLELEDLTITDLLRLLLQTFLSSTPGQRSQRVGQTHAAIERFLRWTEQTQGFELAPVLAGVQEGFVDHVSRLELAALALGRDAFGSAEARQLYRVVEIGGDYLQIAAEDSDHLQRVSITIASGENLRPRDLLLAALQLDVDGRPSFAGMVDALPPITRNLLG